MQSHLRPPGHTSLVGLTVLSMLADEGTLLLNFWSGATLSGLAMSGLAILAPPPTEVLLFQKNLSYCRTQI